MSNKIEQAMQELEDHNVPVIDHGYEKEFWISGESNDDIIWADYQLAGYDVEGLRFGINDLIHSILEKYGMYCEWKDGGTVGCYHA